MGERAFSNGRVRVVVSGDPQDGWHVSGVEARIGRRWQRVAWGTPGGEFATSLGGADAAAFEADREQDGSWRLRLSGTGDGWQAEETITLAKGEPYARREQRYRFVRGVEAAVHPGFRVKAEEGTRYTFPLRAYAQPLASVPPLRADVTWALPLPFHVWHGKDWVAYHGVDRTRSGGTLDFAPPDGEGFASLRVYYPDTAPQNAGFQGTPAVPGTAPIQAGTEVVMAEVIGAKHLGPGEDPLLEAEKVAAAVLLGEPGPQPDLEAAARGIADFYPRCELWEPNALGERRGWFLNMWVYTQSGTPQRRGPGGGYFDLGWGEGIAAEIFVAAARHWKRTGRTDLLRYVDEMTRSLPLFRRGSGPDAPYFDRSDGRRFLDFIGGQRIWTHSLAHTGSQLLQAYVEAPDYPRPEVREGWREAAGSMARFLAGHQKPDGDLQDIFDNEDREVNAKPHRIAARAAACGLWARWAQVSGDRSYLDRALRLARAVAPEIEAYAFYNQMIDGLAAPIEFTDGEAAYYALEGLAPLYAATKDPGVLLLCRRAVAFGVSWSYFFDLPHAHRGIARGGQACRMPDFPLLYPIGPAKAVEPLLCLHRATRDPFYERMAGEMARFIGSYPVDAPGKPWHGGMVHAIEQYSGKHWGPDKAGQVDTGMATRNSLAAIECWLAHRGDG